MDLQISIFYWS